LRYLFHRETAEISQLDDSAFSWIDLFQLVESDIERDEFFTPFLMQGHHFFQWNVVPGSFAGLSVTRMVYQNLAHQSRGHTIEMRPVLPVGRTLVN
jgi:hypothetical protein